MDVLLTYNEKPHTIHTDTFSKPTNNHSYLLANSSHPKHTIKAIPNGVFKRIRKVCDDDIVTKRLKEYAEYLSQRQYPEKIINKQL